MVGIGGRRQAVGDTHTVTINVIRNAFGSGGPVEDDLLAVEVGGEVGGTMMEQGVDGGQGVNAARAYAVGFHGVADPNGGEFDDGVQFGGTQVGIGLKQHGQHTRHARRSHRSAVHFDVVVGGLVVQRGDVGTRSRNVGTNQAGLVDIAVFVRIVVVVADIHAGSPSRWTDRRETAMFVVGVGGTHADDGGQAAFNEVPLVGMEPCRRTVARGADVEGDGVGVLRLAFVAAGNGSRHARV